MNLAGKEPVPLLVCEERRLMPGFLSKSCLSTPTTAHLEPSPPTGHRPVDYTPKNPAGTPRPTHVRAWSLRSVPDKGERPGDGAPSGRVITLPAAGII